MFVDEVPSNPDESGGANHMVRTILEFMMSL